MKKNELNTAKKAPVLTTLSVRVRREIAEEFDALALARGTTAYGLLRDFVLETVKTSRKDGDTEKNLRAMEAKNRSEKLYAVMRRLLDRSYPALHEGDHLFAGASLYLTTADDEMVYPKGARVIRSNDPARINFTINAIKKALNSDMGPRFYMALGDAAIRNIEENGESDATACAMVLEALNRVERWGKGENEALH